MFTGRTKLIFDVLNIKETLNINSISIEAGHISTNMEPNEDQFTGVRMAVRWGNFFKEQGLNVIYWLYIDNYSPIFQHDNQVAFNLEHYLDQLASIGFCPDNIRYQKDMIPCGKTIIEELKKNDRIFTETKTGNILLKNTDIILYEASNTKYACPLLDSALYLQKLKHTDYALSFLSNSFDGISMKAQQKKVKSILKLAQYEVSDLIHSYFYKPEKIKPATVKSSNYPSLSLDSFILFMDSIFYNNNYLQQTGSIQIRNNSI